MSRMPRRLRAFTAAAVLLLPLGFAAASGAETPKEGPAAVEVHLKEYLVDIPKDLSPGPTTFKIRNDGIKNHSFKIEGPGLDQLLSKPVHPGETGTLAVTLQPGEYKVYCPIGNHSAKGMAVTLKVAARP